MFSVATTSSCRDLERLEPGACGNLVIDAQEGEDCDTVADSALAVHGEDLACGAADLEPARRCRYVCGENGTRCPTGWGCGADGICRQPSGELLRSPEGRSSFLADVAGAAELNGDGRTDLIGAAAGRLAIRFGDSAGRFPFGFDTGIPISESFEPVFADLTGDRLTDAIIPNGTGMSALLSGAGGTLSPVPYSSLNLGEGVPIRMVAIRISGPGLDLDAPLVILEVEKDGQPLLAACVPSADEQEQAECGAAGRTVPIAPGSLSEVTRIPTGDLDTSTAARTLPAVAEVAIGLRNAVHVIGVAVSQPEANEPPVLSPVVRARLPLGARELEEGIDLVDVDGDGHLDLLASMSNGQRSSMFIGQGNGDGTFQQLHESAPLTGWALAWGDLNGDRMPDYVGRDGVYESDERTETYHRVPIDTESQTWKSAAAADFNRDGRVDLAVSADRGGVTFLLNAGDAGYSSIFVPAEGEVGALVAGDFDGDLVPDLAIVERSLDCGEIGDQLTVLYGDGVGPPSDRISMGRIACIHAVSAVRLRSGGVADLTTDLVVTAGRARTSGAKQLSTSAVLMNGTSERRLLSIFGFKVTSDEAKSGSVRVLVGPFAPPGVDRAPAALPDLLVATPRGVTLIPRAAGAQYVEPLALDDDRPADVDGRALSCVSLVAGEIDGDPSSGEIVGFGDPACGGGAPRLLIAKVSDDSKTLKVTSSAALPGVQGGSGCRVLLEDADGDGDQDVLALPGSCARVPGSADLLLFRNSGGLGSGSAIDPGTPLALSWPRGRIRDAAVFHADQDPELELAALYESGGSSQLVLFDISAEAAGGFTVTGSAAFALDVRAPTFLVAEDLTSDGLTDLVIGGGGEMQVYLQRALSSAERLAGRRRD